MLNVRVCNHRIDNAEKLYNPDPNGPFLKEGTIESPSADDLTTGIALHGTVLFSLKIECSLQSCEYFDIHMRSHLHTHMYDAFAP